MKKEMAFSKPVWRGLAFIAVVAFFWLAVRVDVYHVTSPRYLTRALFGPEVWQVAHPAWLSLHVWLRKAYSIIAFTIVGFLANRALAATAKPAFRAAAIVGAFSCCIEIFQRQFVAPEPMLESAFDVGCGAFGGWLAVVIDNAIPFAPSAKAIRR
jgi:hypothetical protein